MGEILRTVGKRLIKPIQFHASSHLFLEGCEFNDQIHRLPGDESTCILKGLYRFDSHESANLHWDKCLAEKMSRQMMDDE